MTRIICPKSMLTEPVELTGAYHHKVRTVLKLKSGEKIELLDGEGTVCVAEILSVDKSKTQVKILSQKTVSSPACSITLVQAIAKGKRFDFVLQKATELGVQQIIPIITKRTVARVDAPKAEQKNLRWQEIVRHAAEQSNQAWLPEVKDPIDLRGFLKELPPADCRFVFYEEEKNRKLREAWPASQPKSIQLMIGPEGGFAPEEIEMLSKCGFVSVGLGPLILRSDTAPLVAISLIQFLAGELG
ncbi:16S rRNA (uracil(1498)-N(3))-methyltransferase [Bdellovibrionota bacterium]